MKTAEQLAAEASELYSKLKKICAELDPLLHSGADFDEYPSLRQITTMPADAFRDSVAKRARRIAARRAALAKLTPDDLAALNIKTAPVSAE